MKTFVVKVFGSEYSVKADSDGDHIRRVADIVDRKMTEIGQQFSSGTPVRTAVLACMNMVDEHLQRKRQDAAWVSRRIGSLIDKIGKVV